MLATQIQRPIPKRLCHHTSLEAVKSILSDEDNQGICLRLVSNKCKNDDQEIKMGEYMLERIKEVIPPEVTILHKLKGYNDSASFSFMEGETTIGMLKKYGHYRLEFNLNCCVDVGLFGGLVDCEYVPQNRLKDYANDYCMLMRNKLDEIKKYNKEDCISLILASLDITSFIGYEMDVLAKVFSIKEVKWREEKEWRLVNSLEDNKSNVCYTADAKPYINCTFLRVY